MPAMMRKPPPRWNEIDELAAELGVSAWARRKWQQRGHIPYRWRLPLIEASKGRLTVRDVSEVAT